MSITSRAAKATLLRVVARLWLFAAPFAALHAQPGMVENWFPELLAKVRP